ncbi:maltodextrin glucosidase [Candidatus Oscillochloris fontis]|uniref:maltodextrin glucosidase n=1 Tax=Candidatus Oscillochloris fontis TaxID=2496868 RepID=UPI00101B992D|nr:maltodextrin glucosidase [Candidatus Oscillochloris fontis]
MHDWLTSIHHDGSPMYVGAEALDFGSQVTIRLRADRDAPIEAVFLRTCPDGEETLRPMHLTEEEGVCRWWQVALPLQMRHTSYRFLLRTQIGVRWYNAAGVVGHYPTDANDFKLLADYAAPPWLRDAVFYQIFPDRFADGDPSNNVCSDAYLYRGRPVHASPWGAAPRRELGAGEFFGGDLQGVAQKLDYLEDLGVSALYLNPIFTAPSNHKYDVADYTQVDPHLGGDAALIALRRGLDALDMRLMLDIVPNHCGATHPWFVAAQADLNAPETEFFTFRRHPDEYESWLGVASLPKLDYRSERLRELMYAGSESIMRHWLRPPYRIDAWRIDVANMLGRQGPSNLGHKIGRGIRRAVKEEQPAAYLLGEHFFDGTPHLQGDELDATMNYQGFTFPIWQWLTPATPEPREHPTADQYPLSSAETAAQMRTFRSAIPWQIAVQQFNLLGSHDTPRLRTILGGEVARVGVAATLLFTYPGVPCVYYGDEVGMQGNADPDNRRCMEWDEQAWDHDLRSLFQHLIRLRRTTPALRWGGFQQLYAAGDTLAYLREAHEERLIIVARRADDGLQSVPVRQAGLADGTLLREMLSGAESHVVGGHLPLVGLGAVGAQIWRGV